MFNRTSINRRVLRFVASLYPRSFRDRCGASLEQTIDDIAALRKTGFVTFFDLAIGLVSEHFLVLRQSMSLKDPRIAVCIGLLFMIPGVVLLALLLLGIEPPLGPFESVLRGPGDGPHILGSLIVLGLVVVCPVVGAIICSLALDKNTLKGLLSAVLPAAAIAFLLIAPFAILEFTLGRNSYMNFPSALFGILWLVPFLFLLVGYPIIKNFREGTGVLANPAALALRVTAMLVLAIFWAGLLYDQLPCFLGVPNCD